MDQKYYRLVGDVSVDAGRGAGQMAWYAFAADLVTGHSVVDIGCGLGNGLDLLKRKASSAHGQDLDERLARADVTIGSINDIASKSYDYVTSIDVVEHVEVDSDFVKELARIARLGVFMTTPLSIYGRELYPYHIREYTFPQFMSLSQPFGRCNYYKGSPSGDQIFPIEDVDSFLQLHKYLNNPITNILTRAYQKILPLHKRNMAHQAVLINL